MASSTFTGVENPLSEGGIWVTGIGATADIEKTGDGLAHAATALSWCSARYVGETVAPDQWSEIVVTAVAGSEVGAAVRMQAANGGCYLLFRDAPTNLYARCVRVDDAGAIAHTALGINMPVPSWTAGDRLRLEVRGSTLYGYHNGVLIGVRTDATHTSGQPGIHINGTTSGVDAWNGGPITDVIDGHVFGPGRRRRELARSRVRA